MNEAGIGRCLAISHGVSWLASSIGSVYDFVHCHCLIHALVLEHGMNCWHVLSHEKSSVHLQT